MKIFFLLIISILALIILTSEVLILKDDKTINGKIIKMDEDTMTIYSKDGEFIIDREDIKIIYLNEEEYKKAAEKAKPLIVKKETANTPEMVFVEGGTFMMGDTWGDGMVDEQPVHKVALNSFWIGKYEVTRKEWEDVMGNSPSGTKGEKLPMTDVNWYDAIEFCNALSKKKDLTPVYNIDKKKKDINNRNEDTWQNSDIGDSPDSLKWTIRVNWKANGYRLPTESEWEYAARGGKYQENYKYSGSDNIDAVVWYSGNSYKTSHSVGLKKSNNLGIHDMTGNVYEWCWDWYSNYNKRNQKNPTGASFGDSRVHRGGNFMQDEKDCRISSRYFFNPFRKNLFTGFRVVRSGE